MGKIPGHGLNDGGERRNSCKKKTGHTLLDVWNYLQPLSLEPMNPFPLLTSNTFKIHESTALVCWDINCLQLSAMAASHIHTQLVCFFFITLHTISPSDNVRPCLGNPKDLKISSQHETTQGVMSWPSGKFQSPRMSQWRCPWAIAASRIPCWRPLPSKQKWWKLGLVMREVQHGFGRCFLPMFCIK